MKNNTGSAYSIGWSASRRWTRNKTIVVAASLVILAAATYIAAYAVML